MLTPRNLRPSPWLQQSMRRVAILAALVGTALGIETLVLHLTTDPLADTRLYYDAATRLNEGLPLYVASSRPGVGPYAGPPLLAIAFRPLAMLPFPLAAAIWQALLLVAATLTLRRIGIRGPVLVALGCLALPIGWALTIGQAEVLVTLLLTLGTPASVAVAGYLKLFPWLVAIYWLVRRDGRSLARGAAWVVALGLVQLVLEPAGTLAYLQLSWLEGQFDFRIISPYAIHPLLWVALVVVLAVAAIRLAPTRFGWPAAVALAVLASPRLLVYQLTSLLAAFGGPRQPVGAVDDAAGPPVPVAGRTAGLRSREATG